MKEFVPFGLGDLYQETFFVMTVDRLSLLINEEINSAQDGKVKALTGKVNNIVT